MIQLTKTLHSCFLMLAVDVFNELTNRRYCYCDIIIGSLYITEQQHLRLESVKAGLLLVFSTGLKGILTMMIILVNSLLLEPVANGS